MEARSLSTLLEVTEGEEATEALDTEEKMVQMEEMPVVIAVRPMAKMDTMVDQVDAEAGVEMEATLDRLSSDPNLMKSIFSI